MLATVKRQKLKCYGHVTRSDGLAKVILQGTIESTRRRGKQKTWADKCCRVEVFRRDTSHDTQPAGVERADEEVRHDAPQRLLAGLRGKARSVLRVHLLNWTSEEEAQDERK